MSGLISGSSTALWWRGTTICLRRFSSQRQQFHLTGGPERAVQYARFIWGRMMAASLVTALPVVIMLRFRNVLLRVV